MRRIAALAAVTALAAAGAAACSQTPTPNGGGSSTAPSTTAAASQSSAGTFHRFLPSQVDASLSAPQQFSLAAAPARGSNSLLFVFLAGSGGQPSCCQLLLGVAARAGFHVIGLPYDNTSAVGTRCLNDLACYTEVRRNVFDGSSPTAASSVAPAQAIEHRLYATLAWLGRTYPEEGWGAFVAGGQPSWSKVVLGGHSQGGGEAAFAATIRPLDGVVMLSAPEDGTIGRMPTAAPWLSLPSMAPPGHSVGFVDTGDPFYARVRLSWTALGLDRFGGAAVVDEQSLAGTSTRELLTQATPRATVLPTHDITAVDNDVPLCAGGSPVFAPVWRYMLQVAGGLQVDPGATCVSP